MSFKAIVYAYVLGGLTFIPLLIAAACFYAIYTSVPVGDPDPAKATRAKLERRSEGEEDEKEEDGAAAATASAPSELNDMPRTRRGWLTVRRTFEQTAGDGSYVGLVKGFLDARSKDPKRSRPKDMWYVVLKGKVLYLYEDENMTECEAAIELGGHDVVIFPEGLLDGELFAKRNAICLKPRLPPPDGAMPSVTKEMRTTPDFTDEVLQKAGSDRQKQRDRARAEELEKRHEEAKQEALDPATPWFIFVRSNVEMEDWYLALVHAAEHPPNSSMLAPLAPVFRPTDMLHLVETLDEQPDVIPMRWLNALIGRIFFSFYRTQQLEAYIIGRLMKKLSKVKRPGFLTDVSVREVSVGNTAPTLSKPMLKELTKEGDAALEVHLHYKGEIRITLDATATINLGARFKSYTVKLVLAAVLREIEGNLLIKVKRPPSNRIWYAFTQTPRMVLDVEPVVSDRQITWSMILSTLESRLKEVIQESIVLPNMDDIAFFESSKYKHRGGIWADASRNERESFTTSSDSQEEEKQTPSTPASDPATPRTPDVDLLDLQRSNSVPVESHVNGGTAPDTLPPGLTSRATTISTSSVSSAASAAKRRTWFGNNRDEGATASGQASNPDFAEPERGRTNAPDAAVNRRSNSTPHASPAEASPRLDAADNQSESDETEAQGPSRRSSSRHSSKSAPSQDTDPDGSFGGPSTSPAESLLSGLRSKSPSVSTKTFPGSPTSNFFQTLKTRDKQAISNSAKEAMRKWGVNWGSLKKDTQTTSGDEAVDGDMQRQPARTTQGRPSYAEVRAAVEQRWASHGGEGSLPPVNEPSEPMDIPGRAHDGVPSTSTSSTAGSSGQSVGNASTSSDSPQSDRLMPDPVVRTRSTSPSLAAPPTRQRTVSNHSHSDNDAALNAPLDEDEHPARPIYTQPPAPKTMTIPGIHASHRGEVMSMGYVAPPPPQPEQKKGAAIQSVYRLWKGPQPSQSQSPQLEGQAPLAEPEGSAQQPAESAPSVLPAPPSTPPARPVPPPLPPRSNSTNAVSLLSEPPPHPPELGNNSPPASAALQSIVSKDRTRRASLDPPVPPPLPARRPPASDNGSGASSPALSAPSVPGSPALAGDGSAPPKPKPPALPPRRAAAPA
ncbi:hypothetical protein PsYK624_023430 [Phanerochaete sordida]|uniref:SMP-LTD domain-containing protein n=1 Tax=Phanerochaete sordida TaxID=48140 RepID=A0A9P3L9S3_9APHY|nr:hypothetical protein PsYK624_023430 [Phanerochaete sordida]